MPEEKASIAGIRFANDLRKIREAKGISLEDLYDETKIPRGLLEAFEENGLFEHPMFNRVYLRSFVRTYADVVGISAEIAVQSLDEAVEGEYRNRLAETYLAGEQVGEPPRTPEGETVVEEDQEGAVEPEEKVAPPPEPAVKRVEMPAPPVTKVPLERSAPIAATPGFTSQTGTRPIERPAYSDRSTIRRDAAGEYDQKKTRIWLFAALGVLVIGALSWFIFAGGSEEATGPGVDGSLVSSSTDTSGIQTSSPIQVQLGDTLHATIRAVTDKVQNIKVTVDDDVRRPYWIEQNEERTFQFSNQIILERQLGKIGLTVEGREYPTDIRDDQDRIVITRDAIQSFLSDSGRS